MTNETTALAMSGGVDSSVAAALLLEQGYRVVGLHMLLREEASSGLERARQAAARLGIPLEVADLREPFRRLVLEPWVRAYRQGRTPNPCLACNPLIKFGALLELAAKRFGASRLATGHYARLAEAEDGPALLRGADPHKEQSYFLALVPRQRLARLLFPLGEMNKRRVRELAKGLCFWPELPEESQDVCFLAGEDYRQLLGEENSPGEIVDLEGRMLGHHHGLWRYTVGQRRGLGVCAPQPLYVRRIDAAANRLVVAAEGSAPFTWMIVEGLNWLSAPGPEFSCAVRCRYRQEPQGCRATLLAGGRLRVEFTRPQRAVAPGQGAVFYEGERVLAGGLIAEAA